MVAGLRVHQHHPVALVAQRLAGLRARVVELAGLADDDRPGADDQDALDVGALWHSSSPSSSRSGRTDSRCRAARDSLPGGPGSRTPAGRCAPGPAASRRTARRGSAAGSPAAIAGSTAKPWFWLVITTRPVSRSFTGWLAPWWPNFIFSVFAPEARPMSWWPRQMPNTGMPRRVEDLADRLDGVVAGLRIARAVGQEHAVGLHASALRAPASAPAPP